METTETTEPSEYYLHAVLVDQEVGLSKAATIAKRVMQRQHFIKSKQVDKYYFFKHIPRSYFIKESLETKEHDGLVYVIGKLKPELLSKN